MKESSQGQRLRCLLSVCPAIQNAGLVCWRPRQCISVGRMCSSQPFSKAQGQNARLVRRQPRRSRTSSRNSRAAKYLSPSTTSKTPSLSASSRTPTRSSGLPGGVRRCGVTCAGPSVCLPCRGHKLAEQCTVFSVQCPPWHNNLFHEIFC